MLRTRVIQEEKYFKISSESYHTIGYSYKGTNEGKIYYEEPFISEEDCKAKMDLAIQDWKEMDPFTAPKEPKLEIYWKTIKETIEPTEVES